MKKVIVGVAIGTMLLAGCGANETEKPEDETKQENVQSQETENKEVKERNKEKEQKEESSGPISREISFGEEFEVVDKYAKNATAKIKIEKMRLEENLLDVGFKDEEFKYLLLDVSIENIGDVEVPGYFLEAGSFDLFNETGREIATYNYTNSIDKEGITPYVTGNLRAGGTNEGTIILALDKKETIGEIIYTKGVDEYIIKVESK